MKKIIYLYSSLFAALLLAAGVTYAAFTGNVKILGASVSVGSADIKLLQDLTAGLATENLVKEKPGPVFTSVSPGWTEGYLVKIYNSSPSPVTLTSNANYTTANDPDELRQVIFVEPVEWNDHNNNGVPDLDEMGVTHPKKTIVKWKTEGYNLGVVESGEVKGFMIKFSADSIPDSKQGASAVFDFEFNSLGL